jgi:hypothetical protein
MKAISKHFKRGTVCSIFAGSLLLTAGLGVAGAEPVPAPVPDGLVNVTVGGTTILDSVTVAEAASASAAICGTAAPDVSALVEQVDTQGVDQTVCAGLPGGDLVLAQNVSAEATSPVVPDTSAESSVGEEPATDAPVDAPADSEESGIEGDLTGAGAAEAPSTESEEG